MADYYELDFQDVETKKSGDAILIRYCLSNVTRIHVVDGGYKQTGEKLVENINKYYNSPSKIDAVIVTHADQDHTGGLIEVLNNFKVEELWMLRPWEYSQELLPRFTKFKNVDNLISRLKEIYSPLDELEKIATEKKIKIREPFQGTKIGSFEVLWPTKVDYLNLIVESEKTPEHISESSQSALSEFFEKSTQKIVNLIKEAWGKENFPIEGTSNENEMSVVQYANICDDKILLTGDVGRIGLQAATERLNSLGIKLPGIDKIQIPHHGSRRNINTEILNKLIGNVLPVKAETPKFTAIVSASKEDEDHPRKSVIRAFIHRGGKVISTENRNICVSKNSPSREGWTTVTPLSYPEETEE